MEFSPCGPPFGPVPAQIAYARMSASELRARLHAGLALQLERAGGGFEAALGVFPGAGVAVGVAAPTKLVSVASTTTQQKLYFFLR